MQGRDFRLVQQPKRSLFRSSTREKLHVRSTTEISIDWVMHGSGWGSMTRSILQQQPVSTMPYRIRTPVKLAPKYVSQTRMVRSKSSRLKQATILISKILRRKSCEGEQFGQRSAKLKTADTYYPVFQPCQREWQKKKMVMEQKLNGNQRRQERLRKIHAVLRKINHRRTKSLPLQKRRLRNFLISQSAGNIIRHLHPSRNNLLIPRHVIDALQQIIANPDLRRIKRTIKTQKITHKTIFRTSLIKQLKQFSDFQFQSSNELSPNDSPQESLINNKQTISLPPTALKPYMPRHGRLHTYITNYQPKSKTYQNPRSFATQPQSMQQETSFFVRPFAKTRTITQSSQKKPQQDSYSYQPYFSLKSKSPGYRSIKSSMLEVSSVKSKKNTNTPDYTCKRVRQQNSMERVSPGLQLKQSY